MTSNKPTLRHSRSKISINNVADTTQLSEGTSLDLELSGYIIFTDKQIVISLETT